MTWSRRRVCGDAEWPYGVDSEIHPKLDHHNATTDTSLLQTYQKARDENESRIEAFQMQFPPIFARLTQSVATENEIAAEREALRSGHSAMIEAVETATKAHQDALAKVAKADTQAEYFANGKRKYEKNLEDAQNFLRESKHEMELTLDQAMEFCDDVTVAREELKGGMWCRVEGDVGALRSMSNHRMPLFAANRKQIERELRQLEELLERTQEELGSLDEAVAKSNAKQAMVNAAERDIASSERLANKLSAIHQVGYEKRAHIRSLAL